MVGGRFLGPAAERTEHVPGEDLPGVGPAEGFCPEGGRLPEHDTDRVIVELLDSLQVLVPSSHPAVDRVLPREHDIIGGERAAIVPVDAPLQVPDDRAPVGRHLTVLPARDAGRQDGVAAAPPRQTRRGARRRCRRRSCPCRPAPGAHSGSWAPARRASGAARRRREGGPSDRSQPRAGAGAWERGRGAPTPPARSSRGPPGLERPAAG